MNVIKLMITLVLSYLAGSIPTAVWTGKIFHHIDIRNHGSGNAGATNVIRVLGWRAGIPVMILDVFKGWGAASLPVFIQITGPETTSLVNLQILCGLLAIIGHIYPVFAGFRGGKGVATIFGVLLALNPLLTLSCIGVFLAVLFVSGYVSLSSMSAGVAFPLFLSLFFNAPSTIFSLFSFLVALAIIYTHRKNISRLLKGEEPKFIRFGANKNKNRSGS
jgi:glycerol-3-phosphate acyltransferase PlsY